MRMMMQQQAGKMGLPLINLLRLNGTPILQQLHLEEKLLRLSSENWCIINDGTDTPAIVMGVSGKPSELVEIESVLRDAIPVIRRFTGGGTVIVDGGTVFVTLICNKDAVAGVQPYPRSVCLGAVCCMMKCFEGLVISNSRRTGRDHTEFIYRMNEYLPRSVFIERTMESIKTCFSVNPTKLEASDASPGAECIHSTTLLTRQNHTSYQART